MKITRKQLKMIILEALNELQASAEEVAAAEEELEAQGGAASKQQVADAVRGASEEDADAVDDDTVVDAISKANPDIVVHADGDVVDSAGLAESKKK